MMLRWAAEYAGGTTVKDGEASYYRLNRAGLTRLFLVDDNGVEVASVTAEAGKIPFYRIYTTIDVSGMPRGRFWVLGLRSTNAVYIIVVQSDGTKQCYTSFDEMPGLYEPQWFPSEHV